MSVLSRSKPGVIAMESDGSLSRFRLGPHRVPLIACGNCGTEHHYDAASGEYQGQCRECSAFLRRPTQAEHDKFTEFLLWNSRHKEREWDRDRAEAKTDGGGSRRPSTGYVSPDRYERNQEAVDHAEARSRRRVIDNASGDRL